MAREPVARRPKGKARAAAYDALRKDGWLPSSRGWPDYYCLRVNAETNDTEVCAVLVSNRSTRRLRSEQQEVARVLTNAGIPCFHYSLDEGLFPITGIRNSE